MMEKAETMEKILQELSNSNGITTLDFSDEAHYLYYLSLFDKVNMDTDYPVFKTIIENTRSYHIENKGCHSESSLQTSDIPSPWEDGIFIDYLFRDTTSNKIYGQVRVSLTEEQHCIITNVTLMYNDQSYVTSTQSTDTCHQIFNFMCDSFDPSVDVEEIEVVACVSQISSNMLMTSQALTTDDFCDLDQDNPVENIAVCDPANIKTPEGTLIKIGYGRGVTSGEELDYEYSPTPPNIYLPFRGYVFLGESFEYEDHGQIKLLLDCGQGTTKYNGPTNGVIVPLAFSNGFKWDFPEDWRKPINYSTIPAGRAIDITFQLTFRYHDKSTDNYNDQTIFVSSIAPTPNNTSSTYVQQMPQLEFLWGCLGKDTEVVMADKSLKKISAIKAGESISTFSGATAVVKQVLKGHEQDILSIKAENGKHILATNQHPFITQRGVIRAEYINQSDKLLMAYGKFESPVEVYKRPYNDDVYNLTLVRDFDRTTAVDGCLLCNGFVVGDNDLQNQLTVEYENCKRSIPDDLKNELISLVQNLNMREA
ncbi:MAG: hypothetical protein FD174_2941 [Geobacteraceae bacterium]|nr:MAG: hypothetical protein FD174_2941 [Geobacteraceae bacterium]